MDKYTTRSDERYENDKHRENQYHSDDADDLERRWKKMGNTYRENYPALTDDDVNYKSGEFNKMTERIAKRTNRRREDVENDIRSWDQG